MREIREPRPLNCGGENDRCISPAQKSWEHSEGGMGGVSPLGVEYLAIKTIL